MGEHHAPIKLDVEGAGIPFKVVPDVEMSSPLELSARQNPRTVGSWGCGLASAETLFLFLLDGESPKEFCGAPGTLAVA